VFFNKTREAFQAACILSNDFGMQFTRKESSDCQAKIMKLVCNGANRYEAAIAFVLATITETVFTNQRLDTATLSGMMNWLSTIERLAGHATLTLVDGDPKGLSQAVGEVRRKLVAKALITTGTPR
jgi:hypothetical protein